MSKPRITLRHETDLPRSEQAVPEKLRIVQNLWRERERPSQYPWDDATRELDEALRKQADAHLEAAYDLLMDEWLSGDNGSQSERTERRR